MSDSYLQPSNIHTPQSPRKGRLVGQKPPLKPKEVWSIRIRLQILGKIRDLALFNLAIDSKLRSCDLMALRVGDVFVSGRVKERTVIVQQKTGRPVQFELTEQTREAVDVWITRHALVDGGFLFPSRVHDCSHLSTRQYARIVNQWVASIGLDSHKYGTHSLRRTKAALIYKKTGNLRAVQLVLPENTYCLIFLTFFRDAINLLSSVIIRIQNHETHCLRTVTACVYRDPFVNFAATRDYGTATSTCCVSENNQTSADWLRRPYSPVVALAPLVGVAGCAGFRPDGDCDCLAA